MMFDIGMNVLMMGMCRLQGKIIGMRLIIVPIEFFALVVDFVAVGFDALFAKVDQLFDVQPDLPVEKYGAQNFADLWTMAFENQRRKFDLRIFVGKIVNELFVIRNRV